MKGWTFILFLFGVAPLWAADADNVTPPLPPSPVVQFREWLKMSPEGRQAVLATRPAEKRKDLEDKLKEYEALSTKERERRLCAVELHWYLQQLIGMPKVERDQALNEVPRNLRGVVAGRLKQWEAVESSVAEARKKQILENEMAVKYVSSPQPPMPPGLMPLPPIPADLEVQNRLRDFFSRPEREQEKALEHFAQTDRNEVIATLKAFRALPEDERNKCITSFGQFASMSAAEQAEFLRNVTRWQAMPQEQKETWRELVQTIPPMPPVPDSLIIPPMPGR